MTEQETYRDWRSLELAIKEAAKKTAKAAGPSVSAARIDAPLASDMSAATASDLVATFIDPALDTISDTATWNPDNLTWTTDATE